MTKPTQIFEPGTVVKVPFPYVERPVKRYRPALVISSPELTEVHGLLWALMITSARNPPWAGDIVVTDLQEAGLPVPSVVRCAKVATLDASAATPVGKLTGHQVKLVQRMVERILTGTVH